MEKRKKTIAKWDGQTQPGRKRAGCERENFLERGLEVRRLPRLGWLWAPLPSPPRPPTPRRGASLGGGVCLCRGLGSSWSMCIFPMMVCCSPCLWVSRCHSACASACHLSVRRRAPCAVPSSGGAVSALVCASAKAASCRHSINTTL